MRKLLPVLGSSSALALVAVLAWGCRVSSPPPPEEAAPDIPWFADVTEEVGLHFVHEAGGADSHFMPAALGSGAALFDFDNDGRLDIYLLQNGGPKSAATNRLFRQLPGGRFQDVSKGSGLDVAGYNMGVAVGDVNNDGWPDVLLTQYGGVKLLLNNGDGTFRDATEEAGLSNPAWGASAAFFDFDRDGWLDLVVTNYVDYDPTWPCTSPSGKPEFCPPATFPGRVTRLFRNRGLIPGAPTEGKNKAPGAVRGARGVAAGVRFEDVTESSGLGKVAGPGLGVFCADFDGDGWPDIFVANDGQPNRLWINQHDGTFTEEAVRRGVAYNGMGQPESGMGVAFGDVYGDGLMALFVTHESQETHTLWRQGPRGFFRDRTAASGLGKTRSTGFGTALADFDQDGWLDVAVVNGRIARAAAVADERLGPLWGMYGQHNRLYANEGGRGHPGRFRDLSAQNRAFCGRANVARGLAVGDVNGDGALDLLVTTAGGPARLYRNVAPDRGHWLLVRATDPGLRRDAYGATVRVRAGERSWVRLINPCDSYLCSSDVRAHFGLGAVRQVDQIEVLWPDGSTETFPGGGVDRVVELPKGSGTPGAAGKK
jgi:hypothetical protein